MGFWVEILVNGLTLGACYALIACGLALIFGVVRIVNFAHGEFYMLGGYLAWFLTAAVGYWFGVGAAALLLAVVGALLYQLLFRRLVGERSFELSLTATLGLSFFVQNSALLLFGGDARRLVTPLGDAAVGLAGVNVAAARLLALVLTLATLGLLAAYLRLARTGLAIRAVAQNHEAALVAGIPPHRIAALAVGLGFALTAVAAGALAPLFGVYPTMGLPFVTKAFAIVIIGGLGSLEGVALAAFLLGLTESVAGGLGSGAIQDTAAYLLVIAILLVRPEGLFGQRLRA